MLYIKRVSLHQPNRSYSNLEEVFVLSQYEPWFIYHVLFCSPSQVNEYFVPQQKVETYIKGCYQMCKVERKFSFLQILVFQFLYHNFQVSGSVWEETGEYHADLMQDEDQ